MTKRQHHTVPAVSSGQAAAILAVATRTIQLWCENGILAHYMTSGGHRRVLVASLDAKLASMGRTDRVADHIDQLEASRPRRVVAELVVTEGGHTSLIELAGARELAPGTYRLVCVGDSRG